METPFIVSGKIPPEYFCDRELESRRLVDFLLNRNNVLLISPRRMGKTGLIYHCFDFPEIKSEFTTIFVDILQTTSLQEFTFLLGKAVFEGLASKGKRLITKFIETLRSLSGRFTYDPITGAPTFSIQLGDIAQPTYTLEEIFRFIAETPGRCIVAINEFQQITAYPEKNVEALLRTHIQQLSNCNFIFAGSEQHLLTKMFAYPDRPFYQSTSPLPLLPIPKEVYADFAIRNFKKFNKEISDSEISFLYDKFQGTTYYLQAVMNRAFSYTASGARCDLATIKTAVEELTEGGAGLYREILSTLTLRQKELLVAISKEAPAEGLTSIAFMRRNGLMSASAVQAATKKLRELNLIAQTPEGYTIVDKFLSLWLNQTY